MTVHQDEPPAAFASGAILDGRYRLEERIGWGGMGEIYRGRHLMMNQDVAIKLLRPELAGDSLAAKRFVREARSTFRFDHVHCVRVTDFGAASGGVLFLVMEYLRGRTVGQELLVDGPLSPQRVVHIARQLCDAVAHAHDLGFVHRDLKPGNLMLIHRNRDPDFVKVLDFGLAKLFDAHASGMTYLSLSPLTQHGMVFGTAEYVSPEQATGQALTPASDIYSTGVTLYEMLTGCLPFQGATFTEVLTKHVTEHPLRPSARRPDLAIPPALDALVMDCMAKPAHARPPGIRSVSERLTAIAATLAAQRAHVSVPAPAPDAAAAADTMDLDASPEATLLLAQATSPRPATRDRIPGPAPAASARVPAANARALAGARAPANPGAPSARIGRTGHARRRTPGRARVWGAVLIGGVALAGIAGASILALQSSARSDHANSPGTRSPQPEPGTPPPPSIGSQALGTPMARAPMDLPALAGSPEPYAAPPVHAGVPAHASAPMTSRAPQDQPPPDQPSQDQPAQDQALPEQPDQDHSVTHSSRLSDAQRQRLQQHLAAAEAARRQGNRLKQLAEADSALRIAPASARAAFLLGHALLHSGDKANACKYLHRARRLARARAAYRRAGCAGD